MNDDEKKQLEHIKDDLVKLATNMASDENRPAEERISILMAKIRSEPDLETFQKAKQAIDEMEDSDLKLKITSELIEEIEVARGAIRVTDAPAEENQEESAEEEHLVPDPHAENHEHHD